MLKTISTVALLALVCLGLSACSTTQGSASPPTTSTGQSGGGY